MCLTVDIHTHIIPEHIPNFREKFGYGGFITLDHHKPCRARMMQDGRFFREIHDNCWDPKVRIKESNHFKVDVQVLSTIPVMFSYWAKPLDCLAVSEFLNDHIIEICERYPDRFIGLATVPLQAPDLAIKELERCMKMGMAGVQIGSHVNDWNLSDENLFPFFQAAEELGAAVFIHPWDMVGQDKMKKYWLPWLVGMPAETSLAICSMIFGGVFERLPRLRVAFAHGGGAFPASIGRIEHAFQVRPDLTAIDNNVNPRNYIGKFYIDSLVHEANVLRYLIELFGADKIALGTDYPFPLGELVPAELINSMTDLSQDVKEKLLYKSAFDWLGMKDTSIYTASKEKRELII
ncbi:MAG: amidohydrolase [Cytophagales bacterium]|nr:MAG: amidohydrolase [Cytophagales bacterium]TAH29547.1 MAG: amidohydrolase [Cytophagales bacterium]